MTLDTQSRKYKAAIYLALMGAILLGIYLRLRNITATGLWLDEAFSVSVSDPDNRLVDVYRTTLSDVHPPFYQILLWGYYHVFGFGEYAGRYLSAVIGVLLIPSMFVLGRKLFDEKIGVIAAWLVSINYFLIQYSQETRSYALLVLLTVLSFVVFLRCLKQSRVADFCCYFLIIAALINTHYFGCLPVFSQVLLVLYMFWRKEIEPHVVCKFAGCGLLAILTMLQGLPYTESSFSREFWISPPANIFFFKLFLFYFEDAFLAALAAIILIFGFVSLSTNIERGRVCRLIIFWLVVGVLTPYICSVYLRPVTTYRNFIFLLPAILLVVAYAVAGIKDVAVKTLLLLVLMSFSATPLFRDISKLRDPQNPYSRETHMRDVVISVMNQSNGWPVYSVDAGQFGIYFKILGSSVRVGNMDELISDLKLTSHPKNFYFLETKYHSSFAQYKDFLEKYDAEILAKEEVGEVRLFKVRSLAP
jgi:mannosyltransferase